MLLPEVFTQIGIINVPKWYDAGKGEYFASSSTLFVIEFILFHYVEIRRWQDIKYPGSVNQDPIFKSYSLPPNEVGYPGGIFNPLNFAATEEAKEKEIANGKTIYHTDLFKQMNLTENDVTITYLKSRVLMSCDFLCREVGNVGIPGIFGSTQRDRKGAIRQPVAASL